MEMICDDDALLKSPGKAERWGAYVCVNQKQHTYEILNFMEASTTLEAVSRCSCFLIFIVLIFDFKHDACGILVFKNLVSEI